MKLDKSYKVRVTPLKSARIQHIGFKCGFNWFGQKTEDINSIKSEFLSLTKDGVFYVFGSEAEFENSANEEIEYYDLIALLTDLSKSAENPLQNIELTPEFEAVKPTFKVGDKVYCILLEPKIFTILGVESDDTAHFGESGKYGYRWWSFENLCHATQENYERLRATFPNIKYEQPPKPLTGSDLARAMLDKGWKYVPCYMSNTSDKNAVELDDCGVIYTVNRNGNFQDGYGEIWCHVVPFDPRTGEPLTESILND